MRRYGKQMPHRTGFRYILRDVASPIDQHPMSPAGHVMGGYLLQYPR